MSNRKMMSFLDNDDRIELFNNQGLRSAIDFVWAKIQFRVFLPYCFVYGIKFTSVIYLSICQSTDDV